MSILRKIFGGGGGGDEAAGEPTPARAEATESYKGFDIAPTPVKEGGQYRLVAMITKEVDGEAKAHRLIRADLFGSSDEAARFAVVKARQVIDEQGERLFNT